jgi:hypothetical protein
MAASDHDRARIGRMTGGMSLGRARCRDDRHAGFGGAGRGNGPPERAAPRPGSTLLLPAGGPGVGVLAGQCPRRQARPGTAQDRQGRCGLACQGGRAGYVPALAGAPPPDPAAAGPDPLPSCPDPRPAPARCSEWSRLLEDAQIKLSSVATDIFEASGWAMLAALIDGQRDPKVLAQLARRRLRAKLAALEEALRGSSPTTTRRSCG